MRRASVVEVSQSRTGTFKSPSKRDQKERYDALIDVKAEILDEVGNSRIAVETKVSRSQTVSEKISLIEREKVWFEIIEGTMSDLNTALKK